MPTAARYDGHADWYDGFATSEGGAAARGVATRLLGSGTGALLDVGCGGGAHAAAFAALGWRVTGVDVSEDQLRLARARGVDVVHAAAEELPIADSAFDAGISMCTHTDVDDFATALREVARVLRPSAPFVYLGVHPCFVGPHSRFLAGEGVPELFRGYRQPGRYGPSTRSPPDGIRARVGAIHAPLEPFVQAFVDAGFVLERLEEPTAPGREYPYLLALRWRRR